MYKIEKRDPSGRWYTYTTTSNEYSATSQAEKVKGSFPQSNIRVVDLKGMIKSFF
jgi:hypothetical protein